MPRLTVLLRDIGLSPRTVLRVRQCREPEGRKVQKPLQHSETRDKAALISCIISWAREGAKAAQVEAYGLRARGEIFNPADKEDLNRIGYDTYERRGPWLVYQWGTNDPALKLHLVRLEEPAYTDKYWFPTNACGYEPATVLITVGRDLMALDPDIMDLLRGWDFNIDIYREAVR